MKVELNLPDGLVAHLLEAASLSDMSFDEYVAQTLKEDVETLKNFPNQVALNVAIEVVASEAFNELMCSRPGSFKLNSLVGEHRWSNMSPAQRKLCGRVFANLVREQSEAASPGHTIAVVVGQTQQNNKLYSVTVKE